MSDSPSMKLQQRPSQNIKQLQRLIMSRQMQQAIHFLQVPVMELTPLVDIEVEQNPVLEYAQEGEAGEARDEEEDERLKEDTDEPSEDGEAKPEEQLEFRENDFDILRRLDEDFQDHLYESREVNRNCSRLDQDEYQAFLESSITKKETLYQHLIDQSRLTFSSESDLAIAEIVIGNMDDRGFVTTPIPELALFAGCHGDKVESILKTIQTFDPVGIAARNLQESLLIQLRAQNKENSLAYDIVDKYFDDLLHNRVGLIRTKLHCSAEEIGAVIDHDIAKLDLHPGSQLSDQTTHYLVPDVTLRQDGERLSVQINDEPVPALRLNTRYLRMLEDNKLPKETKEFIRQKVASAKWLIHNIFQRNSTIERIAESLAKSQKTFFLDPKGKLKPLTMKTVADELEVHESTIARAVSNKYIDTPRGILPLRSFFTNAITTESEGDLSSQTVRDILKELISKEDKSNPLSDETLSIMIKAKGIHCARRTIAKYRVSIKIGTAQQRRKYC